MPFQLSPGVAVVEKDFSSIVPAVATSTGAFAGAFQWGPVLEPVTITSENELVRRFGKPTDANAQSFFTAANFLSYTNNLLVVRGDADGAKNSVSFTTGTVTGLTLTNAGSGYTSQPTVTFSEPDAVGATRATATVVLSGAGVTGINLINFGSGYITAPTINIVSNGSGSGATATARLSGAAVTGTTIGNSGYYVSAPGVTFGLPDVAGGVRTLGNAVLGTTEGIVNSIQVSDKGAGYTTPPTVNLNGGGGVDANALAILETSGVVERITVLDGGAGYDNAPTIQFTGGGGSNATATAIVADGAITEIVVNTKGTNYSSNPQVVIVPNVADTITSAASATVTRSFRINNIQVVDSGSGYTNAPAVEIVADEADTVQDAVATAAIAFPVSEIAISNAGSGYTIAPAITFASGAATATATIGTSTITQIVIGNAGSGYLTAPTVQINGGSGSNAAATAVIGTSTVTQVNITNAGTGYSSAPSVLITGGGAGTVATVTAAVITGTGVKINNLEHYQELYSSGEGINGEWAAKCPGALGNSLKVSMADAATFASWTYANQFDSAPGTSSYASVVSGSNDELHIVVIDEDGLWTGVQGSILEKFAFVSKASDAKQSDGTNNYYKNVINSRSQYIWWLDHTANVQVGGTAWGSEAASATFKSLVTPLSRSLMGGVDSLTLTEGEQQDGWAIFADDSQYDISLIPLGKASALTAEFVINNVAEIRKDCVVFVSPEDVESGDVIIGSTSETVAKVVAYRNELPSTSYAVMDSGYKYQYDRYNDKYRYIPLNGDVAGLTARTDYTNDPWFSPGGLNRGQIKNVVKLALNPSKTFRDELYKNGVNPVVTFPGEGTVLFGDKTLLSKPSAFDRINVRRLFIVLEKSIATASKYQLFEFNDGFTRAQFKNLVEPFLRDVQGRRGITEFRVKCDESNNTGEVIDRNEFVADIFIKPARSINFITLNFVAARSGINFNEIGA
jgi:phage tail sheath protein FI